MFGAPITGADSGAPNSGATNSGEQCDGSPSSYPRQVSSGGHAGRFKFGRLNQEKETPPSDTFRRTEAFVIQQRVIQFPKELPPEALLGSQLYPVERPVLPGWYPPVGGDQESVGAGDELSSDSLELLEGEPQESLLVGDPPPYVEPP